MTDTNVATDEEFLNLTVDIVSAYVEKNALGPADVPKLVRDVNAALRGMGYSKEVHTAHGFRAMARTIMDEVMNERVDLIEHQLAHTVKDVNGRAYNRTAHLPARRDMMQRWADYLDKLRIGAEIIYFKAA